MRSLSDTSSIGLQANEHGLLGDDSVAKRWEELGGNLVRLMRWMDSQEVWLKHGGEDELMSILNQLVELSESEVAVSAMHKPQMASVISELLAWVSSSRFFRLLEIMDRNSPNFVNRFALALGRVGGESSRFADLFFERVMVVHKGELLNKVFGENRTTAIAETIQTIRETR